jgi:hypothetical protein
MELFKKREVNLVPVVIDEFFEMPFCLFWPEKLQLLRWVFVLMTE